MTEAASVAGDRLATIGAAIDWAEQRFSAADLAYGHGTDNAADEAAYLVTEVVQLPFDQLAGAWGASTTKEQRDRIVALVQTRVAERKPTAYLVGRAYIGGHAFRADGRALVPRSFIGEFLSEAIGTGMGLPFLNAAPRSILELGAGSGSLAILAALAFPDATVDAIDISPDALALATENVADYRLEDRVRLIEGDLYASVAGRRYDLIISNPPYVAADEMAALPQEYRHEPALGLAGGPDGLDLVRRIVAGGPEHLNEGGGLLCEIGTGQERLAASFPETDFVWLTTEASEGEVFWLEVAVASTR